MRIKWFCGCLFLVLISTATCAQEDALFPQEASYPVNVYWGDTHLHTDLSTDAYAGGNRLDSEKAYRFAKGEAITISEDKTARLRRPLDFLVIADHVENMGVIKGFEQKDSLLLGTKIGKQWYQRFLDAVSTPEQSAKLLDLHFNLKKEIGSNAFRQSVWQSVIDQAERHNEPGQFTAFTGFEWSSRRPYYIHRVVVFQDDASKTSQVLPYSSIEGEGNNPEQLWAYLDNYQRKTGGDALAIPHNANLSDGKTFMLKDFDGNAIGSDYAQVRQRWEPLFEVTQIKGTSEAHPLLSPDDEFADFEIWNARSYGANPVNSNPLDANKKRYEYARSALKLGLRQQDKLGINPFKFGLIGSTDGHSSLSASDENNFISFTLEPDPRTPLKLSAAGYAAVWATDNTREALFAAMKRKEVYASTGPRMTVRFFGGWDYTEQDAHRPDLASIGYSKGVPMGGDLTNAPKHKSPRFLIRATKDPDGANLDRIQVIKGWLDNAGETHEKIYDVALSDERQKNKNSKVAPVGNTVDIRNASYTNTLGDAELTVVWEDPDFNKIEPAFYYVRVIEIPTPRWTAYEAKKIGLKDLPKDMVTVTQERAYTSPIWYQPAEQHSRDLSGET